MTVLSGQAIRLGGVLEPCLERGERSGVSHGLGPAGYDLRLDLGGALALQDGYAVLYPGRFLLAATVERFTMPPALMGIVHDKSTWARRGVSVFNTVIEPGWRGYLTLEIVNHGHDPVRLEQGCGIAQVVFHRVTAPEWGPDWVYEGKYQDQEAGPVGPRS